MPFLGGRGFLLIFLFPCPLPKLGKMSASSSTFLKFMLIIADEKVLLVGFVLKVVGFMLEVVNVLEVVGFVLEVVGMVNVLEVGFVLEVVGFVLEVVGFVLEIVNVLEVLGSCWRW